MPRPDADAKIFKWPVENSNKEKYVYSHYGITFDSAGSWSFDNDSARNVINFGVNNSLCQ